MNLVDLRDKACLIGIGNKAKCGRRWHCKVVRAVAVFDLPDQG